MPVFDSHTHAFPDAIASAAIKTLIDEAMWFPIEAYHDGTIAGLLASMDRAGIERAIMCSVATKPSQVRKITDWSAVIASERIVPFASIHPDFDTVETEVKRIADLGIRGLKFHPQYMNCAVDDPRTIRIARAAADANLAFTVHAGHDLGFEKSELGSPASIRQLHEAVPALRILACHLGGWSRWEDVLEHLAGRPIWFETSFAFGYCPADMMDRIIARHPPEHLLFGTDSPWLDQSREVARFRSLNLSDDVKRAAMWDNILRFLGEQIR